MTRGDVLRVRDVKMAISDIRALLAGKDFIDLRKHRPSTAALERYFEILSEASRS